jgi:hypothetical protein
MTAAVAEPPFLLAQYEALRREALEAAPFGPRGQGLALFLARGMPAWLAALSALAPSPRPRADAPTAPRPHVLPTLRADLTTLLAGMVLACAQPLESLTLCSRERRQRSSRRRVRSRAP